MSQSIEASAETLTQNSKVSFGFWIYLMTDCVLFASLFAAFAVLRNSTYGGPAGKELFSLPFILIETLILLTSSFTCGLATIAVAQRDKTKVFFWFGLTFLLGLAFLVMEITEFRHLAIEGNSWRRSGFLSSFYTLVGAHGLHIASGLIWNLVLMAQIAQKGLTANVARRLTLLSMFWHFLDVIWIFIFTIVYLMGAAA